MAQDAYGNPIEEVVPAEEVETVKTQEELATELYDLMITPVADPLDYSDKYNTQLEEEEEEQYRIWLEALSEQEGRDVSKDQFDYDTRGLFRSLGGALPQPGHGPDTFKKPNHPTFSNESVYHGIDGLEGGHWEGDAFVVGKDNFHDPDDLRGYFADYENQVRLVDTRDSSAKTARIRSFIDQGDKYGKIMSDIQAANAAKKLGEKGMMENIREKIDLFGPSNVIGRSVLLGAGALLATAILPEGAPLWLNIAAGLAGASGGNAIAMWGIKKGEKDVRNAWLRLEADEYENPEDREEDEYTFAEWYNEKRIDEFRGDTLPGLAFGIALESMPYVTEFMIGMGKAKVAWRGLTGLGKGSLAITKKQARLIMQ